MSLSARRVPCPHCGRPLKPPGLAAHAHACARRHQADAVLPGPAVVAPPPALCPPLPPALSGGSALALALLREATCPDDAQRLRRAYVRSRALDWGLLEIAA